VRTKVWTKVATKVPSKLPVVQWAHEHGGLPPQSGPVAGRLVVCCAAFRP